MPVNALFMFEPRQLFRDNALIELLEQRFGFLESAPTRQCFENPPTTSLRVIVPQRFMRRPLARVDRLDSLFAEERLLIPKLPMQRLG